MKLRAIASPLTIAAFIAVAATGLLLFAGYREGLVNSVHEWSSIVFVIGAVLHIVANLKPTFNHLKRPTGAMLAVLFVLVTVVAVVTRDSAGGGNPIKRSIPLLLNADLPTLAALTKDNEQTLLERLRSKDVVWSKSDGTIKEIAAATHRNPMEVLGILLPDAIDAPGER